MNTRTLLALLVVVSGWNASYGQSRSRDGATVGGVAGAVIGGIIGHQNDETPEGALIGGAVGAIAGGLLGRNQDADLARQRYYQQQAYYRQQQQSYAQQQQTYVQQQQVIATGVSVTDIVNMSRGGVSEALILNQIQSKGVQRHLQVSEIITLHQQGVKDSVISAYQAAPLASQRTARVPTTTVSTPRYQPQPVVIQRPATVVVQEPAVYHHYRAPHCYDYHPAPRYHYHHRPATTFRIGF